MRKLDYTDGLIIYGVYKLERCPDRNVVVFDMYMEQDKMYMRGLVFNLNGRFETKVELQLPIIGEEMGHVAGRDINFLLQLNSNN